MKGEKKMEEIEEIERKNKALRIQDGKLWKRVRNS